MILYLHKHKFNWKRDIIMCPRQDSWGGLDLCLVILHLLGKDICFVLEEAFIVQLLLSLC